MQVLRYMATTLRNAHIIMAVVDADTHSSHVANKRLEQEEEKECKVGLSFRKEHTYVHAPV